MFGQENTAIIKSYLAVLCRMGLIINDQFPEISNYRSHFARLVFAFSQIKLYDQKILRLKKFFFPF